MPSSSGIKIINAVLQMVYNSKTYTNKFETIYNNIINVPIDDFGTKIRDNFFQKIIINDKIIYTGNKEIFTMSLIASIVMIQKHSTNENKENILNDLVKRLLYLENFESFENSRYTTGIRLKKGYPINKAAVELDKGFVNYYNFITENNTMFMHADNFIERVFGLRYIVLETFNGLYAPTIHISKTLHSSRYDDYFFMFDAKRFDGIQFKPTYVKSINAVYNKTTIPEDKYICTDILLAETIYGNRMPTGTAYYNVLERMLYSDKGKIYVGLEELLLPNTYTELIPKLNNINVGFVNADGFPVFYTPLLLHYCRLSDDVLKPRSINLTRKEYVLTDDYKSNLYKYMLTKEDKDAIKISGELIERIIVITDISDDSSNETSSKDVDYYEDSDSSSSDTNTSTPSSYDGIIQFIRKRQKPSTVKDHALSEETVYIRRKVYKRKHHHKN